MRPPSSSGHVHLGPFGQVRVPRRAWCTSSILTTARRSTTARDR